jgi:hypothetical protein
MRTAGEVVEIQAAVDAMNKEYEKDRGTGSRGVVREFSDKSRRRLAKMCAAIPWGAFPFLFVTLTYASDFPTDGRVCSYHLRHFRERWQIEYGAPLAVWKREYQKRGAVHFHLAIGAPAGVPLVEVQRWVSRAWSEVIGEKGRTGVEVLRKPPTRYFSSHGEHGRDEKGYQNEVPDGFVNPGRFWGFWNIAPDWHDTDLGPEQFVEARRIMRAWARSKGYRVRRNGGRVQGMWLRTARRPSFHLAADVMRAVQIAVT